MVCIPIYIILLSTLRDRTVTTLILWMQELEHREMK